MFDKSEVLSHPRRSTVALTFEGDVVIVTGAARGLGRAHARLLSALGARVVVNDIGTDPDGKGLDDGAAAVVVGEIEASGGVAVADTNDGSTVEGAQRLVAHALDSFGRLDAVVANAGIVRDATFHNVTDDDFFAVLDVHQAGTMRVFQAAISHMRHQGYGRLVATTSAVGLYGYYGMTAYATAKMGIVGLVRALALEGATHNIKANAIAPAAATRLSQGLIDKLPDPTSREATLDPDKVAPLVAYLCHRSLEASGQIISAGGGRFARVGIGVGRGVFNPEPDADFVAASFDKILADEILVLPANAQAEVEFLLRKSSSDRHSEPRPHLATR